MKRLKQVLWLVLVVLGYVLLVAGSLLTSVLYHVTLPESRDAAARALESYFASELKGRIEVGEFERIRVRRVVARDVKLYDPQGRLIVSAERVDLLPDLKAILFGTPRIAAAHLSGGEVTLIDAGDGLPTLISTFEPRVVTPDDGLPALEVLVEGISLERVRVRGELLGLRGIHAEKLSATGAMRIGEDLHVRIDSAETRLQEPFAFEAAIERITGTISTKADEGVVLRMRGRREQPTLQTLEAVVRYAAPNAQPDAVQALHIEIDGENISTDTLHDVGFDWMPDLMVPVRGRFALHGPPEDFTIDAQLGSEAGAANVQGRISEQAGFTVTIDTDRLELAKALPNGPPMIVSGHAELAEAPTEAATRVRVKLEPMQLDQHDPRSVTVPGFELKGAFEGPRLRIGSLDATHPGARFAGRGYVDLTGGLSLDVEASIEDIARDPALGRFVPGARGRLHAKARISSGNVQSGEVDLDGHVDLTNFSYNAIKAARLEVSGTAKGDPERPELRLNATGKAIEVSGYALGDAKLRVTGGPRNYKAEGQIVRAGERNFWLNAAARVEGDTLVLDADPIELRVGEGAWRGALKGLRLASDRSVELENLRLANRAQRLEARGKILANGGDEGSVLLQNFDLSVIAALVGERFPVAEGHADAQLSLAGDLRAPVVQLQGALRNGAVQGVRDVNAVYFVVYENGAIDLDAEVDLGDRGLIQARGSGAIDPKARDLSSALLAARYALSIGSQGLRIDLAPALEQAGIRGRVSGELRVEGTLDSPELHGSIDLDPLELPDLPPLQAVVEIDHSGLDLRLRASLGDAHGPLAVAQAQAEIPLRTALREPATVRAAIDRGPWSLSVQSIERRLDQMPEPLRALAPYPAAFAIKADIARRAGALTGRATWNATWQGALPDARCAIDILPRARGTIELRDDEADFEFFVLVGPRRIATLELHLGASLEQMLRARKLSPPEQFQAHGKIDVPSMEKVPYLCEYGRGKLNAELELDGGRAADPIFVGALDASFVPHTVQQGGRRKSHARGCGRDPITVSVDASADGKALTAKARMGGCHGGTSKLDVSLPLDWEANLVPVPNRARPLSVKLDLEGAQLAPLIDRIPGVRNSDMLARGTLAIDGTLDKPRAAGRMTVEQGRLYLVSMGQELTEISANVALRQNWAKIEHLRARSGSGTLEVVGGLGFESLLPRRAQVALRARDFPVLQEGVEIAWLTGSAAADAKLEDERMLVAAKTHALSVRLPDMDKHALQGLDAHPDVVRSDTEIATVSEPYTVELQLDGRRGVNVRRNDFDARLITELAVQYRDPEMRVGGYVEFRGGQFETLGRPFDIERGSLRFDGSTSLNPEVLLVATHQPEAAGSWTVTVTVTGTLAEPEIAFSSEACPGDVGAVTYLISGQCVADDPDLAQESEDAQQAFAIGIAGSSVLTLLGTPPKVAGVTPRVGVESGGHGYDTRFKAGVASESLVPKFMRKLVRRMYVQGAVSTRSTETGELEQQRPEEESLGDALDFLIELYFPHNIVGSGKFSPSSWGVDVIWEP